MKESFIQCSITLLNVSLYFLVVKQQAFSDSNVSHGLVKDHCDTILHFYFEKKSYLNYWRVFSNMKIILYKELIF